jgi:hypothetical protein
MRKLLLAFLLCACAPAFATTYYVNGTTGSSSNTCTQAQSTSTPKDTIAHGVACMGTADTVVVYAGTYNENVTVPAGAGGGAYNTVTVNGSDVVSVLSFVLNSHDKLIGNCAEKQGTVTSAVCGFFIANPSSPGAASCVTTSTSATDVYIVHNNMYACANGIGNGSSTSGAAIYIPATGSFIYIQGNTCSYPADTVGNPVFSGKCVDIGEPNTSSTSIVQNVLIENNDFSHYTLGVKFSSQNSLFRNNSFHDQLETEGSSNMHTDIYFSEQLHNVQFNTIEGNYERNAVGANAKGVLAQGDSPCLNCTHLIVRYDQTSRIGSGVSSNYASNSSGTLVATTGTASSGSTALTVASGTGITVGYEVTGAGIAPTTTVTAVSGTSVTLSLPTTAALSGTAVQFPTWPYIKNYNNTHVDLNMDASCTDQDTDLNYLVPEASLLNQIYYYNTPCNFTNWNSGSVYVSNSAYGYNLYYCIGSGCASPYGAQNSGGGLWLTYTGNQHADPKFANYVSPGSTSNDYHLQSGSPAIAAGTHLTTVASSDSGSGTSLVVNDAAYFTTGYGLTNANSTVYPDCISITTVGNHVCVTAINYATNTLTMASGFSRSSGDPVWLYSKSDGTVVLTGSAPDLGALPFQTGSFVASPLLIPYNSTGVSVTLTGTSTTWNGSTAFSVSGVSGTSLVSSTNNSTTSETLVLNTGANVGTLTITDTTDSISGATTVYVPVGTPSYILFSGLYDAFDADGGAK